MKQKTNQILYAYWNEVRAGRLAPRRLEIEPSRIAGVLPETFILERTAASPPSYPYRLAGTKLCELFGWELRGTDFLAGWGGPDRTALARLLTDVCDHGAVGLLAVEGVADAAHRVEIEVLLLPLAHTGSAINRVVGAMAVSSSPHWVGTLRLEEKHLLRSTLTWPDGRPHSLVARSGWQAPFLPPIADARTIGDKRRSFRVLDGGLERDKSGKD